MKNKKNLFILFNLFDSLLNNTYNCKNSYLSGHFLIDLFWEFETVFWICSLVFHTLSNLEQLMSCYNTVSVFIERNKIFLNPYYYLSIVSGSCYTRKNRRIKKNNNLTRMYNYILKCIFVHGNLICFITNALAALTTYIFN